jgi:hypothetical protein
MKHVRSDCSAYLNANLSRDPCDPLHERLRNNAVASVVKTLIPSATCAAKWLTSRTDDNCCRTLWNLLSLQQRTSDFTLQFNRRSLMHFIQRVAIFICVTFMLAIPAVRAASNIAPTITGTPLATTKVNVWYMFLPTAKDANADKLGFSISNKPSWMTFSTATGRLWGTPTSSAVGTYSNIVISVSDGVATTSLPAFSIKVITNIVSSASGAPSATVTPPVPTSLSANAGNTQVKLAWVASAGATGYKLKRSTTSGGPYSVIDTSTITSYSDYSVTNGMDYYYVVAATTSANQSADSAQVQARPVAPTATPTTFGTWTNVTPSNVKLTADLSCGNFGTSSVQKDPAHPSHLYAQFHCQGIWKSTDYGATWSGPINTGRNGATVGDCAGGISIPPGSTANVPTLYLSCGRGAALGFWVSTNGGVDWTKYQITPTPTRQDYYPPDVDPYDSNHLVMTGHEMNSIVQSFDGGRTWSAVNIGSGMTQSGGTGATFFINTGNATSTRSTWLWMAQWAGGTIGTWRTTNGGATWVQVDKNEHTHGSAQIYQPDNNGVLYMAGAYSDLGWGVLRSTNYGQTWAHVGSTTGLAVVVGTSKNMYAMFGYPTGAGGTTNPGFELSAQPGTGTWVTPGTPASMTQGPSQIATVNDGTRNILVGAMWNGGLWRYIEP